jgi:hypothetical protein
MRAGGGFREENDREYFGGKIPFPTHPQGSLVELLTLFA